MFGLGGIDLIHSVSYVNLLLSWDMLSCTFFHLNLVITFSVLCSPVLVSPFLLCEGQKVTFSVHFLLLL